MVLLLEIPIYANLIPLITLIAMLCFVLLNPLFEQRQRKLFIIAFVLDIIMIVASTANYLMLPYREGNFWIFRRFTTFMNFAVSPVIPFILMLIYQRKKIKFYYAIPLIINTILSIMSLFFKVIFFITEDNSYDRGPLFFMSFATAIFYILLMIIKPTSHHSQSRLRERAFLICSAFTLSIGMVLEIVFGFHFLTTVSTVSILVLYYLLLMITCFTVDTLTGAYNRLVYSRKLHTLKSKPFIIAMIDLNKFKDINDTYGHDKGDECLINVTNMFHNNLPHGTMFFRIGGDEFVVMSKSTHLEHIKASIIRLNEKLTDIHFAFGMALHDPNTNINDTLKIVDQLMYENKKLLKEQDLEQGEKING